jgi:hypothetical protein
MIYKHSVSCDVTAAARSMAATQTATIINNILPVPAAPDVAIVIFDADDVETQQAVMQPVRFQKLPCGTAQTLPLTACQRCLGRLDALNMARFDFDKNQCVAILGHKINLTDAASVVAL